MNRDPIEPAAARVLVTNDDGIHAPGLAALERIAADLSPDVWVVAPETEQSATSHSLTLRRPLRISELGARRYCVDGTPTDCVLVAQHRILADRPADLVLSGVNRGANLGEDVTYSGTVAAAMEGALLGARAIALSATRHDDGQYHWATTEHWAPRVIRRLLTFTWPKDLLVNVNFPGVAPEAVAGLSVCRQGRRDEGTTLHDGQDPKGRPYVWIGEFNSDATSEPDTDLAAIDRAAVAITPLHLDLTHHASLVPLAELFA